MIVGAGAAGLSAAWKLARSGLPDVVVLELEDHPGGTAAWGENAVNFALIGSAWVVAASIPPAVETKA